MTTAAIQQANHKATQTAEILSPMLQLLQPVGLAVGGSRSYSRVASIVYLRDGPATRTRNDRDVGP